MTKGALVYSSGRNAISEKSKFFNVSLKIKAAVYESTANQDVLGAIGCMCGEKGKYSLNGNHRINMICDFSGTLWALSVLSCVVCCVVLCSLLCNALNLHHNSVTV